MLSRAQAIRLTREQRQRREFTLFARAINTPLALSKATAIAVPGNGTLYVEAVPSASASLVLTTGSGRDVGIPALASGAKHNVGYFPQGERLVVHAAFSAGVRLYVQDGVGKLWLFAET